MQNYEKLTPDTSVIIERIVSRKIENKEIKVDELIIHEAVLAELEHQANQGREIGYLGLEELKKLKYLSGKHDFKIKYLGVRPRAAEIKHASLGEIDSLIRELAYNEDSVLITADKVQSEVALAKGMKIIFVEKEFIRKKLKFEKYFDNETMSVHLREETFPYAKRGLPGNWNFIKLDSTKLKQEDIQEMAKEIVEEAKARKEGFIEIERRGSSIIQLGTFRIVITRPPFSDGWEITLVRPIKKMTLEEYKLEPKILARIERGAEGILIAGAPGQGKCVDGEEIIYTKDLKKLKVKDFYNSNRSIIYSIDKNGKNVESSIISKFKRKEHILHNLRTMTHREIMVTADHPLLTLTNNGELKWIGARYLKKRDLIAVIKELRTKEYDDIDLLQNYPENETLCIVNNLDKEMPIYSKYIGSKRAILYCLCNNISLDTLKLSKKYILEIIRELVKNNDIIKNGKNLVIENYHYNLKDHPLANLYDLNKNKVSHSSVEKVCVLKKYSSKSFYINNIKRITPEFSRLLGYIYSEGGGEKFCFTNSNELLLEDFKLCAEKALGITNFKTQIKIGSCTLYIDYKLSIEPVLNFLGYPIREKNKSVNMKLPEFLYRCSKENLANFLGAYFDGDGSVDATSGIISFYTSSNNSAGNLSKLLLRFGIFNRVYSRFYKGRLRYTVQIFDVDSIRKFKGTIPILSKDKKQKLLLLSKNKKYDQTFSYPIKSIISRINWLICPKIKENVGIVSTKRVLNKIYELYYNYVSINENKLLMFKNINSEVLDTIKFIKENKPSSSKLSDNHLDHNIIKLWENGQNIKISTLNKIAKSVNGPLITNPKHISDCLRDLATNIRISIGELSRDISYNNGTLAYKINHGWETNFHDLEVIFNKLENIFHSRRLQIEAVIQTLNIIINSDLVFDKIIENNPISGDFEVYDFETNNHNFICGEYPILVHNSTFAAGLAEFYASREKIVKTIEAPRDLHLSDSITQYAISYGSSQEIHDILLLSRPDYTIFDEMRNVEDFNLFADLRLAGIGLVGVVHATNPIDAIQRFIGKMETGVIPSVIDTIIFIKNGAINKILTVKMSVKVPSGMTEADLARPVVEVNDFMTGSLEYEIYSYGEETVVISTSDVKKPNNSVQNLAKKYLEHEITEYSRQAKIEISSDNRATIYVPESEIARIIGKQGKTISEIEKNLGISIDVKSLESVKKENIEFEIFQTKKAVIIKTNPNLKKHNASIFLDGQLLFSEVINKSAEILINKKSELGRVLSDAISSKQKIEIKI